MYFSIPEETIYTAKLPDGRYVYGTDREILEAGGERASYEEGEAAGNVWDSLRIPREV